MRTTKTNIGRMSGFLESCEVKEKALFIRLFTDFKPENGAISRRSLTCRVRDFLEERE